MGATRITVLLLAGLLMLPNTSFGQKIPLLKDAFKNDFAIGTALNMAQIEEQDPQTTAFIVGQFNMATPENIMKSAKGKVFSWDVVNEALNEDSTLRKSVFLQHLDDNYVTEAFRLAQEASPDTELYHNDYNNEQPAKRAGCLTLIKRCRMRVVRIDGVGIQGHWYVGRVPLKDIEESILQYAVLGLKVMFTELDIEALPRNVQGADVNQRMVSNEQSNPYVNGLPNSVQQQLAANYKALFRLFLKHRDKITRVTFWGVKELAEQLACPRKKQLPIIIRPKQPA